MILSIQQGVIPIFASLFLFMLIGVADAANYTKRVYNLDEPIQNNFISYSEFALYYFPQIHYFDKYFTIVLFAIGFPGNFVSFLVWSNRRMYHGNSAAVYLAALSLNDTIVLAIALFRDLTRTWEVPYPPTPGSCEVLETITLTVQYASPMFVLAFTMERWLAICQPFLVSRICSVRFAVRICAGIIIFTLFVCSPMAYLMGTDESGCQPRSGAVFYFTTTLEIIYSLVTPLLVLTFNCLVINEMAKIRRIQMKKMLPGVGGGTRCSETKSGNFFQRALAKKRTSRMDGPETKSPLAGDSSSTAIQQQQQFQRRSRAESGVETNSPKFKSTTIMLLVVSFYVIFATLLGGFWYVMEIKYSIDAYANLTMKAFQESEVVSRLLKLRMCKIFCDELALSHFAMGFVLYYSTGKNFRDGVHRLFSRCNIFSRGKNRSDGCGRISVASEAMKRRSSARINHHNTKAVTETTEIPLVISGQKPEPQRQPHRSPNKLVVAGISLRGKNKRDEFPGLDNCGKRGERQPSKLVVTHRSDMNNGTSDPAIHI